jgi:hypothetical protein
MPFILQMAWPSDHRRSLRPINLLILSLTEVSACAYASENSELMPLAEPSQGAEPF